MNKLEKKYFNVVGSGGPNGELIAYEPLGHAAILKSVTTGKNLACIQFLYADSRTELPMLVQLRNQQNRFQVLFPENNQNQSRPFGIAITNLCSKGFIKIDLMIDDKPVTKVDDPERGINQVNELNPYQSYFVNADQTNQNKRLMTDVSKKTSPTGTVSTVTVSEEEQAPATEKVGKYIYVTVTCQTGVKELEDSFTQTHWTTPDLIVIESTYQQYQPNYNNAHAFLENFGNHGNNHVMVNEANRGEVYAMRNMDSTTCNANFTKCSNKRESETCNKQKVAKSVGLNYASAPVSLQTSSMSLLNLGSAIGSAVSSIMKGGSNTGSKIDKQIMLSGDETFNDNYSFHDSGEDECSENEDSEDEYDNKSNQKEIETKVNKVKLLTEENIKLPLDSTESPHVFGAINSNAQLNQSVHQTQNSQDNIIMNSKVATIKHGDIINVRTSNTHLTYRFDLASPTFKIGMSFVDSSHFGKKVVVDKSLSDAAIAQHMETIQKIKDNKFADELAKIKVYATDECVVCMESVPPAFVFFKCGHACICSSECGAHLKECPICRSSIVSKISRKSAESIV